MVVQYRVAGMVRGLCGLAMLAGVLVGSPVMAQDGTPGDEPPVIEEPIPTEAPPPTEPPAPTEVPTEIPVEPATEEPTVAIEPTVPEVTPTIAPEAELTYRPASSPTCELAADQPAAIASDGRQEFACTVAVSLNGANVTASGIAITWTVQVETGEGWALQLLPPPASPGDPVEWTTETAGFDQFMVRQPQPLGAGSEPAAIETTATIQFRLLLHRGACIANDQPAIVHHAVGIESAETVPSLSADAPTPEPLRLYPSLAPLPEPSVGFGGALEFADVAVDSDGLDLPVQTGTLDVLVHDLDTACGAWTLHLTANDLTDANGTPVDGALVVVSVNGLTLETPCNLVAGCDLATLVSDPEGAASTSLTLGIELRLGAGLAPGALQTTLDAALLPAGASS